jgi:hypothetical protein
VKWNLKKPILFIAVFSLALGWSSSAAADDEDDLAAKIKLGWWQVSLQGNFYADDEGTPGSIIKFDRKDFADFDRAEPAHTFTWDGTQVPVIPELTLDVGPFRFNVSYWKFEFMADEILCVQDFSFGGLDFPAAVTQELTGSVFIEEIDVSLGFNLLEFTNAFDLWAGAGARMYGIGGKFEAVSLIPMIVPEFETSRTERMPVPVLAGQAEAHVSFLDFGIRGAWCNYRSESIETDINLYDVRGYIGVSTEHIGLEAGYHFLRLDCAFGQFDKDPIAFDGTLAGAYIFAVLKF